MPKMNPIVEEVIRKSLEKPEGELTEADLEKVMELSLEDPEITEESLEGMAKLTQFHMLLLVGTKTTDVDLKELAKLQQLSWLVLDGTNITDTGIKDAAKLKQLACLCLGGSSFQN